MSKKDKTTVKEQEEIIKKLKDENWKLNCKLLDAYSRIDELVSVFKDIKQEMYPLVIAQHSVFSDARGVAEYVYDTINCVLDNQEESNDV